jgi:hypothetical protein
VKQQLAAIRHLFDWLVTGQVMPVNPAASVRGPRHVVRSGKTKVLEPTQARHLLNSIDASTSTGLTRQGADLGDGLQSGSHRSGTRHESRGRIYPEPAALGAPA